MPEKRKRQISRRRFLQVGLATVTSIGAGITTRWMRLSQETSSDVGNCSYSWASYNMTRLNENSSALFQDMLIADGLNPTRAEVYDRAMEYQTCYDVSGNIISKELLFRDNERALVVFAVGEFALSEDIHRSIVETVLNTLTRIEAFRVQTLEVQVMNGEERLIWQAPSKSTGNIVVMPVESEHF